MLSGCLLGCGTLKFNKYLKYYNSENVKILIEVLISIYLIKPMTITTNEDIMHSILVNVI